MDLVRYSAARTALAEAYRVDEAKEIRDKALALAVYAEQAKDHRMILWATEIRVRAERRCGELLREAKARGELREGRPEKLYPEGTINLPNLGISRKDSSNWQKLAEIPESDFEAAIEARKNGGSSIGTMTLLAEIKRALEHKQARQDIRDKNAVEEKTNRWAEYYWRPLLRRLEACEEMMKKAEPTPQFKDDRRKVLEVLNRMISILDTKGPANAQNHS